MTLTELTSQPWDTIMLMPYGYFIDNLKWKVELEEEKQKKVEDKLKKKRHNRKLYIKK